MNSTFLRLTLRCLVFEIMISNTNSGNLYIHADHLFVALNMFDVGKQSKVVSYV